MQEYVILDNIKQRLFRIDKVVVYVILDNNKQRLFMLY
jgi:hypothetical protein